MDLTAISPGQMVKNYKELASLLNEPVLGGKYKKYQLRDWERYFNYIRKGNAYIITEIFDTPKMKIDERTRGIFVQHIEILILELLYQTNGRILISRPIFFEQLGLCNNKYNIQAAETTFLTNNTDISETVLKQFKSRSYIKFNEILDSSLKSLERRKLIEYGNKRLIEDLDNQRPRIATEEEVKSILEIERSVLLEMGYSNIGQIYAYDEDAKYYSLVNKRLEDTLGWKRTHKVIEVIASPNTLLQATDESIIRLEKNCLNLLSVEALNKQAETQLSNYIADYNTLCSTVAVGEAPKFNKLKYPDNFLEIQRRLSDYFVAYIRD